MKKGFLFSRLKEKGGGGHTRVYIEIIKYYFEKLNFRGVFVVSLVPPLYVLRTTHTHTHTQKNSSKNSGISLKSYYNPLEGRVLFNYIMCFEKDLNVKWF